MEIHMQHGRFLIGYIYEVLVGLEYFIHQSNLYIYIYIYIYICVCVCVCVCADLNKNRLWKQ